MTALGIEILDDKSYGDKRELNMNPVAFTKYRGVKALVNTPFLQNSRIYNIDNEFLSPWSSDLIHADVVTQVTNYTVSRKMILKKHKRKCNF